MPFFRRSPPEAKHAGPLALSAVGAAAPAWTPRADPVALIRASYVTNAIAHRCVRLIAEGAAALPLRLEPATEPGRRIEAHPLLDLLDAPNPAQDRQSLLEALHGHLALTGNAYVEAVGGAAPAELHVLRPDRMRVIPGPSGWAEGFEYRAGGRVVRFAQDEAAPPILHLRAFHPLDDHYGLSPLQAAAAPVDVHNAASRWNKALLDNAARPCGAVVYDGPDAGTLTPEQRTDLRDQLEALHQGAANAGRPMLLEGGLDWKPMGLSPSEMEFMAGKDAAAREIALAFGVPPLILGLPGDNTYANHAEAHRAFRRHGLHPVARRVCAALSRWLGGRWGGVPVRLSIDEAALGDEADASA